MARAQDASAWQRDLHAGARLVGGEVHTSAAATWLRAGIEIQLDPGWKTYWRYPGDSGMPPTFDFSGSKNVKTVTVQWPAPERFPDGAGGHSIGYMGGVVLPLRVVAQDAAKPSLLDLKLNYAVCGNLCVPAQAELDLVLSGKVVVEDPSLVAAEARIPRRGLLGAVADPDGGLTVRSVHRETDGAVERIVVDVGAPAGVPVDLFVEGPTPEWALPLPEPVGGNGNAAPGLRRFTFALDGLPPGARAAGATLTFTAVSPTAAIEVKAHLD